MSFTVTIDIKRNFDVNCSYDKVFELFADVPRSVSHFPKVDQLVDLGDNSFRWEMDKIGVDKYSLQTIYACKYISNKDEGTVVWEPVEGVGNGIVKGRWKLKDTGDGTHIDFHTNGKLTIPLPSLTKFVIGPVVEREFNSLVDKYHENLKKTFRELA